MPAFFQSYYLDNCWFNIFLTIIFCMADVMLICVGLKFTMLESVCVRLCHILVVSI